MKDQAATATQPRKSERPASARPSSAQPRVSGELLAADLKKTKLHRDDLLAQLERVHRETAEMRNENAQLKVANSHFQISQDEALKISVSVVNQLHTR